MTAQELKDAFPTPPPSQEEMDAFLGAAGKGDMAAVTAFLDRHPSPVDRKNNRGNTALILAVEKGQREIAELLLARGAQVNLKNNNGWAPLAYAAWNGHLGIAEMLLEKGAAVDAKDHVGWTPLMRSIVRRGDAMLLLLEKGADIEAKSTRGLTPLMLAACTGSDGIAWVLLDKGADAGAVDIEGKTAALLAREKGHPQVARTLEQWSERQRQREAQKLAEIMDLKAKKISEAQLEKLKGLRPKQSPFKKNQP
jgi:ankyrin repeat protein